ncbi:unnamed protein product [Amoebophrya sp. A25]|nr:unnamed protein product [Amoebophrya sp. A25]|eukprot:GSA25T00001322001.1
MILSKKKTAPSACTNISEQHKEPSNRPTVAPDNKEIAKQVLATSSKTTSRDINEEIPKISKGEEECTEEKDQSLAVPAPLVTTRATSSSPATEKLRFDLRNNSLFVLGLDANADYTHSIRRDKRLDRDKREDELAFGGERISLTFRLVKTFLRRPVNTVNGASKPLLVGQGAPRTFRNLRLCDHDRVGDRYGTLFHEGIAEKVADLENVAESVVADETRMVHAFSLENRQSLKEFDWHAVYGQGFDSLYLLD